MRLYPCIVSSITVDRAGWCGLGSIDTVNIQPEYHWVLLISVSQCNLMTAKLSFQLKYLASCGCRYYFSKSALLVLRLWMCLKMSFSSARPIYSGLGLMSVMTYQSTGESSVCSTIYTSFFNQVERGYTGFTLSTISHNIMLQNRYFMIIMYSLLYFSTPQMCDILNWFTKLPKYVTMMSHERHGVSNHQQLCSFFNSLFG